MQYKVSQSSVQKCSFKRSKLCVQLIVSLKLYFKYLSIRHIGHRPPSSLHKPSYRPDWIFISLSLSLSATGPRGSHMPTVCTHIHRPSSLGLDLSAQITVKGSCAILSDPVSNADCRLAITAWVFCQWGYANSPGIIQPIHKSFENDRAGVVNSLQ